MTPMDLFIVVPGMPKEAIVLLTVMAMHASVSLPIKHAVPVEEDLSFQPVTPRRLHL